MYASRGGIRWNCRRVVGEMVVVRLVWGKEVPPKEMIYHMD